MATTYKGGERLTHPLLWVCLGLIILGWLPACGSNPYQSMAGTWQTAGNNTPGFGREAEIFTFSDDGVVTLKTPSATIDGVYSMVNGAEIRIEWKEQPPGGHSQTEIFTIAIELHAEPAKLSLTNSDQKSITYYRVQSSQNN